MKMEVEEEHPNLGERSHLGGWGVCGDMEICIGDFSRISVS